MSRSPLFGEPIPGSEPITPTLTDDQIAQIKGDPGDKGIKGDKGDQGDPSFEPGPAGPPGQNADNVFLGDYDELPLVDRRGEALKRGQVAYHWPTRAPYVWHGDRWTQIYRLAMGASAVLTYNLGGGQAVISGVDSTGQLLDLTNEVMVYLNGVLVPPTGYVVSAALGSITLLDPPDDPAVAVVHQVTPVGALRPGAVVARKIASLTPQFDGTTRSFQAAIEDTGELVPNAASTANLSMALDGILQEPGVDFVLEGDGIVTFARAPAAGTAHWGVLVQPDARELLGNGSLLVQMPGHGFVKGDVVYHRVGLWRKAKADSDLTLGFGVVGAISASTFTVVFCGVVQGLSGLTPGWQFTSISQAGALTAAAPTDPFVYVNPMGYAPDPQTLVVIPMRASFNSEASGTDSSEPGLDEVIPDAGVALLSFGMATAGTADLIIRNTDPPEVAQFVFDTGVPVLAIMQASDLFAVGTAPLDGENGEPDKITLAVTDEHDIAIANQTGDDVQALIVLRAGPAEGTALVSTGVNIGGGASVYAGASASFLQFRTLVSETDALEILTDSSTVTFSIAEATDEMAGLLSAEDKAKLDGIPDEIGSGAVESVFGRDGVVVAVTGDYSADQIEATPSGSLESNTVEGQLVELDENKAPNEHEHDLTDMAWITGMPTNGDVVVYRSADSKGHWEAPSGGSGGDVGEIDGGRADSVFLTGEVVDGGDATGV